MKPAKYLDAAKSIEKRMKKNYENAYDFHRRSGIKIAYYTIVRFFDPEYEKAPNLSTMIEIAHYAGMSRNEIKSLLERVGDNFWTRLIGEETNDPLTPKESALIGGVRKVVRADQSMWQQFGSTLKLTAAATSINVDEELAVIG